MYSASGLARRARQPLFPCPLYYVPSIDCLLGAKSWKGLCLKAHKSRDNKYLYMCATSPPSPVADSHKRLSHSFPLYPDTASESFLTPCYRKPLTNKASYCKRLNQMCWGQFIVSHKSKLCISLPNSITGFLQSVYSRLRSLFKVGIFTQILAATHT